MQVSFMCKVHTLGLSTSLSNLFLKCSWDPLETVKSYT